MKPNTRQVMQRMIGEIRRAIPFEMSSGELCEGECNVCSLKLIEYLDLRLVEWQERLDQAEVPTFGDLSQLEKTSRKIHRALCKQGLIKEELK